MYAKFWGTRGSLPRPVTQAGIIDQITSLANSAKNLGITTLDDFVKSLSSDDRLPSPLSYGGNTTCTQIGSGEDFIIVDSGSGLMNAGDTLMAKGIKEFHIFQTHFHWDHIMGMPFFIPMYVPGFTTHIHHIHKTGEEDVKIQFNGRNFPLKWDQIGGEVNFHQLKLYEPTQIGKLQVTPFALDHPGGSFGYRVEADGRAIAIGVDGEYKRFSKEELGKDLPYYQDLDAFVFDGQYDMDELVNRYDWGHCTPPIGVDLALREGIKNMIFTHHDPRSSDEKSRRMLEDAAKYLTTQLDAHQERWNALGQPNGPNLFSAYDGMQIMLDADKITVT